MDFGHSKSDELHTIIGVMPVNGKLFLRQLARDASFLLGLSQLWTLVANGYITLAWSSLLRSRFHLEAVSSPTSLYCNTCWKFKAFLLQSRALRWTTLTGAKLCIVNIHIHTCTGSWWRMETHSCLCAGLSIVAAVKCSFERTFNLDDNLHLMLPRGSASSLYRSIDWLLVLRINLKFHARDNRLVCINCKR